MNWLFIQAQFIYSKCINAPKSAKNIPSRAATLTCHIAPDWPTAVSPSSFISHLRRPPLARDNPVESALSRHISDGNSIAEYK